MTWCARLNGKDKFRKQLYEVLIFAVYAMLKILASECMSLKFRLFLKLY